MGLTLNRQELRAYGPAEQGTWHLTEWSSAPRGLLGARWRSAFLPYGLLAWVLSRHRAPTVAKGRMKASGARTLPFKGSRRVRYADMYLEQ